MLWSTATVFLFLPYFQASVAAEDFSKQLQDAIALQDGGRITEAEKAFREAINLAERIGENDLRLARALDYLATFYTGQYRFREALPLYRRSSQIVARIVGPEDVATARALSVVCESALSAGELHDAEVECSNALAVYRKILPPNHPDVGRSLSNLGVFYLKSGDYALAEPLLRRALHIAETDPESRAVSFILNNLGSLYSQERKFALAERSFAQSIALMEKTYGPGDPAIARMLNNLGSVYLLDGKFDRAAALFRRTIAILDKASAPTNPDASMALLGLTRVALAQGRRSEAEELLQRVERLSEGSRTSEVAASLQAAQEEMLKRKHTSFNKRGQ